MYYLYLMLLILLLFFKPWKSNKYYFIIFYAFVVIPIIYFFKSELVTIEIVLICLFSLLMLLNLRFDYNEKDYISIFSKKAVKGNKFLMRVLIVATLVFIALKIYFYGF